MMEISLMHLKKNLVQILTEDQNVRENAFENELTRKFLWSMCLHF